MSTMSIEQELAKLKNDYARDLPRLVAPIQKAVETVIRELGTSGTASKRAWLEVDHLVHKFAGSSGTYGFTHLSTLARYLEDLIRDGELAPLPSQDCAAFLGKWYSAFAQQAILANAGKVPTSAAEAAIAPLQALFRRAA